MQIVETRRAEKAIRNDGNDITKYQDRKLLFVTLGFKPLKTCS